VDVFVFLRADFSFRSHRAGWLSTADTTKCSNWCERSAGQTADSCRTISTLPV